ncbi:hypothetical protein DRQ09_00275, partial [candidate division KSB1 bacterium]
MAKTIDIKVDNVSLKVKEGITILQAARENNIYIPALCSHPDLPDIGNSEFISEVYRGDEKFTSTEENFTRDEIGCNLCLVKVEGKNGLVRACETIVEEGMRIYTNSTEIIEKRQENLMKILSEHPHACLTCSQKEGCTPVSDTCPSNVVKNERCCALFGNCEFQRIVEYIGVKPETPGYKFKNLPVIENEPLYLRNYNYCINCGRCVRVCRDIKGVKALGMVYNNGRVIVGTVSKGGLVESGCKFCGSCIEVCPTGALQDKKYIRLRTEKEYVPCKSSCPAGINIPLYIRLIEEGKYRDATEVIREKIPFPRVLGKVCFHPCEDNCRRGELADEIFGEKHPIAIKSLKDFVANYSFIKNEEISFSGKKVAVIGGGPAGLSCAYFLAKKGHKVVVFEANDGIGGLMRFGIPRFRLPHNILEPDLKEISLERIEFKTNTRIGEDIPFKDILQNKFDAVFIACGCTEDKKLNIEGENLNRVISGLSFLKNVSTDKLDKDFLLNKDVIVVGGGNVAVDSARTAIRLSASNVTVVCLEKFNEMPAYIWEIEEAIEEDIMIENSWGPEKITFDDGKLNLLLKKCISVFNEKGEFFPQFDTRVKKSLRADYIIVCIGQKPELSFLKQVGIKFKDSGLIDVNNETMSTSLKGVFAGGDAVSGPSSVVEAVADGRKAAKNIDKFLGGDGIIDKSIYLEEKSFYIGEEEGFALLKRYNVPKVSPEKRKNNFNCIEFFYDEETARKEAHRCLRCDMRTWIKRNPEP